MGDVGGQVALDGRPLDGGAWRTEKQPRISTDFLERKEYNQEGFWRVDCFPSSHSSAIPAVLGAWGPALFAPVSRPNLLIPPGLLHNRVPCSCRAHQSRKNALLSNMSRARGY